MGRPIERTEKRARGDRRIDGTQLATPDSGGEEGAHAALITIAFGHDQVPQRGRKRVHFEMRRRPFEFVDEAAHVRQRERPQPVREWTAGATGLDERREQPIERAILAEEQNLVLAAEIVVQVRGGQIRSHRDVAHACGGITARPEHARGRAEYFHAAGFGANRTAVR